MLVPRVLGTNNSLYFNELSRFPQAVPAYFENFATLCHRCLKRHSQRTERETREVPAGAILALSSAVFNAGIRDVRKMPDMPEMPDPLGASCVKIADGQRQGETDQDSHILRPRN